MNRSSTVACARMMRSMVAEMELAVFVTTHGASVGSRRRDETMTRSTCAIRARRRKR